MGKYLNPTNTAFEMAINSEVFVDKSEMLKYLNSIVKTTQRYVSVSRPRRFGKTFAADMICAYYGKNDTSRELFSNLKLANSANSQTSKEWDCFLGKFDVIRLVMTDFFKENVSAQDALNKMQQLVIRDLKRAFPSVDLFDDTDLIQTLDDIFSETLLYISTMTRKYALTLYPSFKFRRAISYSLEESSYTLTSI